MHCPGSYYRSLQLIQTYNYWAQTFPAFFGNSHFGPTCPNFGQIRFNKCYFQFFFYSRLTWISLQILLLITRLIVINIASLTVLFCSCLLFVTARSLIYNCSPLKDISFNTKCLLVWCN